MDDLTPQLRERIRSRLEIDLDRVLPPITLDAIIQDVRVWHEVQAVKRERAAYVVGASEEYAEGFGRYGLRPTRERAVQSYLMPTRTREVLREEPLPNGDREPPFRVKGGTLEWCVSPGRWITYGSISAGDFALMRHALDLHDNPTRTEVVPVDEGNPWGDT